MNKKKILSLIMALVMLVGVFSPLTALAAEDDAVKKEDMVGDLSKIELVDEKPTQTKLTIHKLVADSYKKGVPVDHNGGTLDLKTQLSKLGENVKPLAGVKFTIYKIDDAKNFETIKTAAPKTVKEMETYVTAGQATKVQETTATDENGVTSADLGEGNYWVVESGRPSRVTKSLAVPFAITLPLMNQVKVGNDEAGTKFMKEVHVYPKNIEKKPEMDKAFGKLDKTDDKLKDIDSKKYKEMLEDWKEEYGPQVDQYTRDKKTIDARVGSKVPYEVKTSLKQGQKYTILSWSDVMTAGLKYNKDVTLTYKDNDGTEVTVDLTNAKTETDFGFDIKVNDETVIQNINTALEKGDVEFTLKYTATLTNDAVVDLPESNNITFTPGEPNHKNNNEPKNPTSGEVTVNKTWAKGTAPDGVLVTYILFEGDKPVASVTLKGTTIQSSSLPKDVTVTNNGYNVTFKGLDNNKTYKIEEFADGYDPEYSDAFTVKNNVNPDRITPTPPYVVTYGKKFVKTDDTADKTRLAGAEFKIKNAEGKYLVAKTGDKIAAEAEAVKTAKTTLDKAVEDYNKLEATAQTETERAKVTTAQEAYNKAVKEAGNVYEWGSKDDAITLVSDGQGRFEITGLAAGEYKLEETKAPKGFAKLSGDIPFTVGEGSYTKDNSEKSIDYVPESKAGDAQQVENKNLTIPQTGGMGTVLFTIVGISLMAGAVVAMKRNREEA